MKRHLFSFLMISLPVLTTACVSYEEPFDEVRRDVAERTGQEIAWAGVSTPEAEVEAAVDTLLEGGLTVEEAVQVAMLSNRRLQAVYEDYGIALAEVVQASLPENPVFSGEYKYLEGHSNIQNIEFEIVQDFVSVLFIPMRRSVAKAEQERAGVRIMAEVVDTAMDTKRAFHHLQADTQIYELWKARLLADEAAFELGVRAREAGTMRASEVLALATQYEETRREVAEAEEDLVASREHLNQLMGLWGPRADWELGGVMPNIPDEAIELDAIERRAIEKSIDLEMAYLAVKLMGDRGGIRNIESVFPEFEAGAAFEGEEEAEAPGEREWLFGPALTLSIPLFNWGQASRAISRAEVRRQWNHYLALATELRSAARTAAYRLAISRDRAVHVRDVALPRVHDLMDQAQLQYNGMFIGPFGLLEAKQDEITLAQQYLLDLSNYWLARTDVEQILMGRMVIRAPEDRPDIINADIRVFESEEHE